VSAPLVLAVDTTAVLGSVAIVGGGERTIAETELRAPDGYDQLLFDEIGALLKRSGLTPRDIDLFASASGPGSFTGVRVGLTAMKGLAAALDKPAIGISNLRAMAALAEGELRTPILDARRGEIFGAVYNADGRCVIEETVAPMRDWLARIPAEVTFVLTGAGPFDAALPPDARRSHVGGALAATIGRIAASELVSGRQLHPAAVDANYVRRADAESKWTDR